jgi:hypothetical protein
MQNQVRPSIVVIIIALIVLGISQFDVERAFAQGPQPRAPRANLGTAFTYQGQLKDNSAAANGAFDFQFALYDAVSIGAQVGSTINANDVNVSNGYFTVSLDFGASAFTGDARYLEIRVRPGASVGAYTTLNPRQAMTPAPYALALPGLYTQQNATSPNVIGGYSGNSVTSGVLGATIGGGGQTGLTNRVTDNFGTIGGGYNNQAGDNAGTTGDKGFNVVGGGASNVASGGLATISGGTGNIASATYTFVGGGGGNVASFNYATVGGGYSNEVTDGMGTIAGGYDNTIAGIYGSIGGGRENIITATASFATVPGGRNASASHYGEMAYASGYFSATGDAQTSTYVVRNTTSNNTPTELFLDGSTARITIATNRVLTFDILVVGVNTTNGNSGGYRLAGVIKNIAGTTSFVGTPNQTILGEDTASWDATVVADNTNDALVIQVTGAAGATIRWVATVRTVEVSN